MTINFLTCNIGGTGDIRRDTLEGVDYLVVPSVMMVEGVHSGSQGSKFYSANELAKTPEVWNQKPVVVNHPQIEGQPVSACSKEALEKFRVGVLMNTQYDEGLKTECWIDVEKANNIDDRIVSTIVDNQMMEVSTGVFVDDVAVTNGFHGTSGESYEIEAVNHRPDHLALLPDSIGACSVEKGAGLNRNEREDPNDLTNNEISFDNIYSQLSDLLDAQYGESFRWIEDIYRTFAIISMRNDEGERHYKKVAYTVEADDVVSIGDTFVPVKRVVEWRTVDGNTFVANSDGGLIAMGKNETVSAIIANGSNGWVEKDRSFLLTMNEDQLSKVSANNSITTNEGDKPDENKPDSGESGEEGAGGATNNAELSKVDLSQLPPELQAVVANLQANQAVLDYGKRQLQANRAKAVDLIKACTNNQFSDDELSKMDINTLEKLAAMAEQPANQNAGSDQSNDPGALYFGAGFQTANEGDQETTNNESGGLPVLSILGTQAS